MKSSSLAKSSSLSFSWEARKLAKDLLQLLGGGGVRPAPGRSRTPGAGQLGDPWRRPAAVGAVVDAAVVARIVGLLLLSPVRPAVAATSASSENRRLPPLLLVVVPVVIGDALRPTVVQIGRVVRPSCAPPRRCRSSPSVCPCNRRSPPMGKLSV